MSTIGPYTKIRFLGKGGNGEVWECRSTNGESVAVKVLKRARPGSEPFNRFQSEVAVLRQLGDHDGILLLIDAHVDGSPPYWLAMPIATPLLQALDTRTPEAIIAVCSRLARVLADLHSRGISHRDIKPDNLFSFNGRWVFGDFGLVDYPEKEPVTDPGRKLGPAWYIAPEMLNAPDKADGRQADIYSFAKTMWVFLTGQRYPLPGPHDPLHISSTLTSFIQHPRAPSLDKLLAHMTSIDPLARPDAAEVAKQLDAWSTPLSPSEQSVGIDDALARAREAVLRPQALQKQQQSLIDEAHIVFTDRIVKHADALVATLTSNLALDFHSGFDVPGRCKRMRVLGTRPTVWEDARVYEAQLGTIRSVVFKVICVADLSDNGRLFCSYSIHVFPKLGSSSAATFGSTFLKGGKSEFQIGLPEMETELQEVLKILEETLPEALQHFTTLAESHVR